MNRIAGVAVGLVVGCAARAPEPEVASSGQTYAQALEIICHVDERAGVDPEGDPIGVDGARWDYIKSEVTNPDAVYFRTVLQVKDAAEQAAMLTSEAARGGLGPCPLAEALEAE